MGEERGSGCPAARRPALGHEAAVIPVNRPRRNLRPFDPKTGVCVSTSNGRYRAGEIIPAFSGPVRPTRLKPGEKIYRVLDRSRPNPLGLWWTHELPPNGRVWREECAVLEDWSKNGLYAEMTVHSQGLWIWEGKVSSQIDRSVGMATSGQYLKGGGTQILLDLEFEKNLYAKPTAKSATLRPTNWTDLQRINIPDPVVTTQKLGEHEIATKKYPRQLSARALAKAVGSSSDTQKQSTVE
jgi:hypothetical protein